MSRGQKVDRITPLQVLGFGLTLLVASKNREQRGKLGKSRQVLRSSDMGVLLEEGTRRAKKLCLKFNLMTQRNGHQRGHPAIELLTVGMRHSTCS